jgi:glutamate synthase domain-containing protein 3
MSTVCVDLANTQVRALNAALQGREGARVAPAYEVLHPMGKHALAVGLTTATEVTIRGHVGYYCAGMNQSAIVTVTGNAGTGVAENMMSGTVRVTGDASQSAGATGHGGLLVIEGDASSRCGIGLKGLDIVVGGSVGHMSAFMAQAGRLVVCGDAGAHLGDSIYEAEPARGCRDGRGCGGLSPLWLRAPSVQLQYRSRGELLTRPRSFSIHDRRS